MDVKKRIRLDSTSLIAIYLTRYEKYYESNSDLFHLDQEGVREVSPELQDLTLVTRQSRGRGGGAHLLMTGPTLGKETIL